MTQELINFREKYPAYNDIGDSDLADMLSKKYPDAYGDLPGKITPQPEEPPAVETEKAPSLDVPKMTSDLLDKYNNGQLTQRQIAAYDELKKRGVFDPVQLPGEDAGPYGPMGQVEDIDAMADYAIETIKNVPGSAAQVIKELVQSVKHPVKTAKGIAGLGVGAAETVKEALTGEDLSENLFTRSVDAFDERFGTPEKIKETVKTDPVGFIGDIAALFSGAGSLFRTTQTGAKLTKIGAALEPFTPAAKAIKKTVESVGKYSTFSKTAKNMMQSAVKFSTTLSAEKRKKLAETALESGIMPTYEGLDKLWGKINETNKKIADKIDVAAESGERLNVDALFDEFDLLEKDALLSATPIKKKAAINGIRDQITKANEAIGRKSFDAAEAQKLKQNIYKDIQEYYEKNLKLPPSVSAQKAVAKRAKVFLEEIVPGIKEMNKKDGDYIALMNALDRPVSRIENRGLGLGMPTVTGIGTAIGSYFGHPELGAAMGFGLSVLQKPTVKAKLAIVIDKMEKQGIDPGPEARAFMVMLEESRKIEDEE